MLSHAPRAKTTNTDDVLVSDVILARLYRASALDVPEIVDGLPGDAKARLAAFCYSRAHLRAIGRVIAARCEDAALLHVAGSAIGACLLDAKRSSQEPSAAHSGRAKVTLATAADMRRRVPVEDDELDD